MEIVGGFGGHPKAPRGWAERAARPGVPGTGETGLLASEVFATGCAGGTVGRSLLPGCPSNVCEGTSARYGRAARAVRSGVAGEAGRLASGGVVPVGKICRDQLADNMLMLPQSSTALASEPAQHTETRFS